MPHNKPKTLTRAEPAIDAEETYHRQELEDKAWMARYAQENGLVGEDSPLPEPGAEEAIAHLKSMSPEQAVQKAREWTGRTDITTLAEAIAAVQETAGRE